MQEIIVESDEDLRKGVSVLSKNEPKFSYALSACGLPTFRKDVNGFEALFKIIVGQQLSTSAAQAIWTKLKVCDLTTNESVVAATESTLRNAGLSKTKVSYVKGLALTDLDYGSFERKSNAEVIQELTAVRGIGLWTAQIYLMFSLRRSDVFAPGDLALKEGARNLLGLKNRPSSDELNILSQGWKPYRTIAALILWNYYGYIKKNEILYQNRSWIEFGSGTGVLALFISSLNWSISGNTTDFDDGIDDNIAKNIKHNFDTNNNLVLLRLFQYDVQILVILINQILRNPSIHGF